MQAQQFVHEARVRLQQLEALQTTAEREHSEQSKQIDAVEAQLKTELDTLTTLYLPSLDPAVVARVKPLTGYGYFASRDVHRDLAEDRARHEQEKAAIEADPDFQQRENLLNPTTGDLSVKLKELGEQHKLLADEVKNFEAEPHLLELFENGYGTPAYPYRWWNVRYYSDWKWGDIFLERFQALDFPTLKAKYEQLRQDRDTLGESLREVKERYTVLTQREERHTALLSYLSNHEEHFLRACRAKLRDHLAHVDREQLFEWSKGDRAFEAKIKTIHGLEKKVEYLTELVGRQYTSDKQAIQTSIGKLNRKIAKFTRPKNYYAQVPPRYANEWLGDGGARLRARRDKFRRNYEVVYVFDHYDRYDYARDILWWDLMTDGRIDGDFIPEVGQWHQTHGAYDRSAFASAGANTSAPEPDESSFSDPS
jgi:hypothetical protein